MARWREYRRLAPRPAKFRNVWTPCDAGKMHQSGLEAARCDELRLLEAGGLIRDLEAHPQPKYALVVEGATITTYSPDFRYVDCATGQTVVEDTKAPATAALEAYQIKRRLLLALYGVEVTEVRRVRGRGSR